MKSDVGKESYKRHCLAAQSYFQGMFDRLEAQGRSRAKGWAMVLRSFLDEKQAFGEGTALPDTHIKESACKSWQPHAQAVSSGFPWLPVFIMGFHSYLLSSLEVSTPQKRLFQWLPELQIHFPRGLGK